MFSALFRIKLLRNFSPDILLSLLFSSSFYHILCVCVAKVVCVKSRDLHWALIAHRDQSDINLSSLRMLLVADGANPCECVLGRTDNSELSPPVTFTPLNSLIHDLHPHTLFTLPFFGLFLRVNLIM